MGKAEGPKVPLERIVKLLALAKELHIKEGEVLNEIDNLMEGKASIAQLLKAAQAGFDAVWCVRYAPGQTGAYVWQHKIDLPNMKRLINSLGLDELTTRFARYLANNEPFYVKNRHPFRLFVSSVNSFAGAPAEVPDYELVPDCRHDPPCRNDAEHTRRRQAEIRQ